nr:MAG TPA: hypothetical protein [Caudoviricetes sp.]
MIFVARIVINHIQVIFILDISQAINGFVKNA